MTAEAATARAQAAPLATWIKELEEELTRVAGDRNTFRSRAKEATASVWCDAELGKEASRAAEVLGSRSRARKRKPRPP
jgi:hypothetical protein